MLYVNKGGNAPNGVGIVPPVLVAVVAIGPKSLESASLSGCASDARRSPLMATDPTPLDEATSRVTAFDTFEALVRACRVDGYVPTLVPRGPRRHAMDIALLTKALQDLGYRVYSGGNNTT